MCISLIILIVLQSFQANTLDHFETNNLSVMGFYYYPVLIGNYISAENHSSVSLLTSTRVYEKFSSHNTLFLINKEKPLINEMVEAKNIFFVIKGFIKQKNEQFINSSINQLNTDGTLLYKFLIILVLISLATTLLLRKSFRINKELKSHYVDWKTNFGLELQKIKDENILLKKQIHINDTLSLLEEDRLKNEIELRNQRLASKALQISSRNNLLNEFIKSLSTRGEITGNSFLSKKLNELKKFVESESELEAFFMHFEEVNYAFLSKLKGKHPNLTTNDIRFICYVF